MEWDWGMDLHKQTWWFVSAGFYALERGLDLAGYINISVAYFLWVCSALSFLWAIYLNKEALGQYHLRLPFFFQSPFFKPVNTKTEKDNAITDNREDRGLARKQAIYIKNDEDIFAWFSKLMQDGHLKVPCKIEGEQVIYDGKGMIADNPDAKGKTIGDLIDDGLELPDNFDTKFLSIIPLEEMPLPDEIKCLFALNYLFRNKIVEPATNEAPADTSEKLYWYFPTEQAELILGELAELNRKQMNQRI